MININNKIKRNYNIKNYKLKKIHNIKRSFRKNKVFIKLVVAILIFPLIIGLFYEINGPSAIPIEPEGLLSFYGTAFGIFASFVTFVLERRKKKEERNLEIKPNFLIELEKMDKDVFKLIINNFSENGIKQVFVYDEFLCSHINNKTEINISYLKSKSELNNIKLEYDKIKNITVDKDIIDIDGYPKYIVVDSEDIDNRMWSSEFRKIKNGEEIFYNLYSTELV